MKGIIKNILLSLAIIDWVEGEIIFPEDGMVLNYTHIMFRWVQKPDCNSYT